MSIARRRSRVANGRIPGKAIGLGLLAGLFAGIGYLCGGPTTIQQAVADPSMTADGVPVVRVRIARSLSTVTIDAADGRGAITYDAATLRDAVELPEPLDGATIRVAGQAFRGAVRVIPNGSGGATPATLDIVNVVSIEQYLRGVVPAEMPALWPAEALKAQAIAARTYALYMIKTREAIAGATAPVVGNEDDGADTARPARAFDLNAGTSNQAFAGIAKETPASDEAVSATRGIVLTDGPAGQEKIFCALFNACCGGVTLGGKDYANGDPTPALAEHRNDGCANAKPFTWPEFAIRKDELTRRVRLWGKQQNDPVAALANVVSVEIAQRNDLGRPTRFAIVDSAGVRYVLRSEQFRNACNTDRGADRNEFLSAFFTPVDAGDSVRITDGHGWGHGVGLCQWCANGWARRGDNHATILAKSYPGAKLVRAY